MNLAWLCRPIHRTLNSGGDHFWVPRMLLQVRSLELRKGVLQLEPRVFEDLMQLNLSLFNGIFARPMFANAHLILLFGREGHRTVTLQPERTKPEEIAPPVAFLVSSYCHFSSRRGL